MNAAAPIDIGDFHGVEDAIRPLLRRARAAGQNDVSQLLIDAEMSLMKAKKKALGDCLGAVEKTSSPRTPRARQNGGADDRVRGRCFAGRGHRRRGACRRAEAGKRGKHPLKGVDVTALRDTLLMQCKHQNRLTDNYRILEQTNANVGVVKADYKPSLVFMYLDDFIELKASLVKQND